MIKFLAASTLAILTISLSVADAATTSVVLRNIKISKPTVRIHRGDSVRWLFRDGSTPHNVTSTGKPGFRSSTSRSSGAYTVRFAKAGTYRYRCTIHPSMTGRIVVT